MELDPQDWENQIKIAELAVKDLVKYLSSVRNQPVWQQLTEELFELATEPLPEQGIGLEETYRIIKEKILPFRMGNIHPRFWGWIIGTGTFSGALADFFASTMNDNNGGGNHAGTIIEQQVINWAKQFLDYQKTASGLLTTGGSMVNIIALTIARNTKCGYDIRQEGNNGNLTIYGSSTHSSFQKGVELLGIGTKNYRKIPVNHNFEIDCTALEQQILQDVNNGKKPVCIVANVGTVNTEAIDNLITLRELADKFDAWLHVDGAFGAVAKKSRNIAKSLSTLPIQSHSTSTNGSMSTMKSDVS